MSETYEYTAGRTKPIIHQLLHMPYNGKTPVFFDATGTTIGLILLDQDGNSIDTAGKVTWEDAARSKAKFTPAAGDLVAGDVLTVHWIITDGSQVFHVPEGPGDIWEVY